MTYATPDDVSVNLGRPLSDAEVAQAVQWIGWAEATIARGPTGQAGRDLTELDPQAVQMVLVEAVTRRLRMPDAVTQQTVSVDDASITRQFQRSSGLIDILPEWWEALGWAPSESGAFSVLTYGASDAAAFDAWR